MYIKITMFPDHVDKVRSWNLISKEFCFVLFCFVFLSIVTMLQQLVFHKVKVKEQEEYEYEEGKGEPWNQEKMFSSFYVFSNCNIEGIFPLIFISFIHKACWTYIPS